MLHLKVTLTAVLLVATALFLHTRAPAQGAEVASSALPLPHTVSLQAFEKQLYSFLDARQYEKLGWVKDKGVRDTGPFIAGAAYGTHPAVRIFYSPEVYDWLKAGRP